MVISFHEKGDSEIETCGKKGPISAKQVYLSHKKQPGLVFIPSRWQKESHKQDTSLRYRILGSRDWNNKYKQQQQLLL